MVYNIKYYCSTPVQLKKILLIIVFYSPLFLNAQFYNGSQLLFGKNRVQYEDKLWTYFRYPKYNVYYTLNGKNLAIYTARYAAEQIPVIEKKLDYTLEENIQFIVFNNLSDLKQSNIGFLSQEQYNTGGITHIVGNKVFLYYNGSHVDFERQIRAGIAYVILEQILYGKSITSMIKNTTLLALPEWYTQGLISYLSDEFNEEVEKHVIDGILSKRYEKFNNLNGIDAIYAGHSIWQYISIKYGENMIPNILYMTKMSRNVESGFLFVLGMSFKSLIREWINYYDKLTYEDNLNRQLPENKPITTKTKKQQAYLNLKISPDGKYAAWVSNNLGKYKIWLYDINKNKAHYIIKYGNKLDDKIDLSFPIIAWHPSGKLLSIIIERKSKFLLYYYELKTKTFTKIRLFDFQKILDFSYSDDGQLMVFSAVQNGQTDLFIFNPASMTYEQITKDLWDDLNPKFIPKTNEIIFSSNRTNDTIVFENENYIVKTENLPKFNNNDIFIYNYKTKSNILKRITNTPDANEIYPSHYKGKYYTYLSNENGIYNRCISYLDSTIAFIDTTIHYKYFSKNYTITDYKRNITEQETNSKIEKTAYIIYKDGKNQMFIEDITDADELSKINLKKTPIYKLKIEMLKKAKKDTLIKTYNTQRKQSHKKFEVVRQNETPSDTNKIDINNYHFGKNENNKKDTLIIVDLTNKDTTVIKSFKLHKVRNYDVEYSINQLVNQIDFSFLNNTYQPFSGNGGPIYINPGFNALFSIGITDLLEDYRITGGIRLSNSLDNNEYFLNYDNIKKRFDKSICFHRKVLLDASTNNLTKDYTHEISFIIKYPFNEVLSIKGTSIIRNDKRVFLSTDANNIKKDNINKNWIGLKAELTYDDTREKGLNLYYGTRYKIFTEYYKQIEKQKNHIYVLGIDFRNYQKIHKTFIWANRIAASTSLGPQRLIYYMGGVDNWLFPKFNTNTNIATNQNYVYQTIATNMRGFHQNIRNGNSFTVINSELRFPIFRYFSNKPLKSDFFDNFQIIAFGDIGTAWTGVSPYSDENSLYTQIIQQGPIKITIKNQKNPIVEGVGFGLRTRILGYFVRADWAYGFEDGVRLPCVFYLSLSLDF